MEVVFTLIHNNLFGLAIYDLWLGVSNSFSRKSFRFLVALKGQIVTYPAMLAVSLKCWTLYILHINVFGLMVMVYALA